MSLTWQLRWLWSFLGVLDRVDLLLNHLGARYQLDAVWFGKGFRAELLENARERRSQVLELVT